MDDRTVLITGCSSGIGRATAHAFLDEGWRVYATARDPADIQTLGDEPNCEIDALDVTDQSDVDRVVSRMADEAGRIDCLVNNAGYAQFGPTEEVETGAVHDQFDVNVYGPHRLTRAVLPHMRTQGNGTIVNVSSVAGRLSFAGGGPYCGSKFALEAMTDALRQEVEPHGIDAVLIEPGPVETEFIERATAEADGGEEGGVERTGAYDWFWKIFEDTEAIGGGGPGAVPPGHVADDVVNAASMTKPPARVPVGPVADLLVKARFLPDSVRDRIVGLARKYLA